MLAAEMAEDITESTMNVVENFNGNWLLIVVVLIILVAAVFGLIKGAFKMIFTIVGIALALVLTILVSPIVKSKLMSNEKLYDFVYARTESIAEKNKWARMISVAVETDDGSIKPETSGNDNLNFINNIFKLIQIPDALRESLLGDESLIAELETSADADINDRAENITKGVYTALTNTIIKVFAYLLTFVVIGIVMILLSSLTDLLSKLPVLEHMNRILGAGAGALIGFAIVCLLFMGITVISNMSIGQKLLAMIDENPFLTFIYNHNFISRIFLS